MRNALVDHLLILFCVLTIAAGQILFKTVALQADSAAAVLGNARLLALTLVAFFVYTIATLTWILVLRRVPLSYAYMFMSLAFVLVPLAGHFLFREPLSIRYLAGVCVIALGLWLAIGDTHLN